MALEITPSTVKQIPASVRNALSKMPSEEQSIFEYEYRHKKRTPLLLFILAIFFPIQHFLEGKIGMGILFLITIGGVGLWYFIGIFTVYGRTKRYNEDLAMTIVRDMKIMGS